MQDKFLRITDAQPGNWLRERLAKNFGDPHTFVPHSFTAYARILHPIERMRPRPPETWDTIFNGGKLDFEEELVSWTQVAAAQEKHVEKYSQGEDIMPAQSIDPYRPWLDQDGWRYGESIEGNLETNTLARIARVLAKHTNTPSDGVAAIWEGWGSGTSARCSSSRPSFLESKVRQLIDGSRALLNNTLINDDVLELPGRNHRLYEVSALDLVDPAWPARAPWTDNDMHAQSPSILWPMDHTWVLATEVDYDSTIISGSQELVNELLVTEGIEAFEVDSDIEERLLLYPDS